LAAIMKVGE